MKGRINMRCSNCGAEITEDSLFCGECGAPVPQQPSNDNIYTSEPSYNAAPPTNSAPVMTCPRCGRQVENGTSFCPNCGYSLDINRTPGGRQYYNQPPHQPQKKRSALFIVLIIIIGVLVLVSAALITFMALNGGAPSATPSPSPIATASPTPTPTPTPTPAPQVTAPPAPAAQPAQAVPAAPPAQSSAAVTSGFVFPSDSVYISEADLNGRSQDEVRLIMNEMYARHGYIFSSRSYQDYFSSKSWYVPVSTSQAEAERKFNSIELANKNVISNYEKKRGWR